MDLITVFIERNYNLTPTLMGYQVATEEMAKTMEMRI
jgi:hypothetical protein